MSECPCRKELLQKINEASFAVDEVKLFFDTHPYDEEALEYFEEYSHIRNEAMKMYAEHYGSLTVDTEIYACGNTWKWVDEPWPWQEGGC